MAAAPKPDLVVTQVTVPNSALVGDSLSMGVELKNQGEADAGTFRLGPYYSSDQTITTSGSYAERRCRYKDDLAAGATTRCRGYIPVPDDLSPGPYYLGAIVDDAEEVDESDEDNNTAMSNAITLADKPDDGGGEIQAGVWVVSSGSSTDTFEFIVNDTGTAITR